MNNLGRLLWKQPLWRRPLSQNGSMFNQFKCKKLHTFAKRPMAPHPMPNRYKNGWNVYDDLKLLSYGSHMIFFMLLPLGVHMCTMKVDVVRDDTLAESSFLEETLRSQVKNLPVLAKPTFDSNLLDIFSRSKYQLQSQLEQQVERLRKSVSMAETVPTVSAVPEVAVRHELSVRRELPVEPVEPEQSAQAVLPTTPQDLQARFSNYTAVSPVETYKTQLTQLYQGLKLGKVSRKEYTEKLSELMNTPVLSRELTGLYQQILRQLHESKMVSLEDTFVQKAILASKGRNDLEECKFRMSQKFRQRKNHKRAYTSTKRTVEHRMTRSSWLRDVLCCGDCARIMVEFAATAQKSKRFIVNLLDIISGKKAAKEQYERKEVMVEVIRILCQYKRQDEARIAFERLEQLYGNDTELIGNVGKMVRSI